MAIDAASLPLPNGVHCLVPTSIRSMTRFVLQEQGDWFEPELALLRRIVEPGWKCVDAGASYGCYTLSLARCVGAAGKVHAIEPHPASADLLERGVQAGGLADRVSLHRVALAAQGPQPGRLSNPADHELATLTQEGPIEVRMESLDNVIPCSEQIDLLKVDVEGGVLDVLRGARRILSNPAIIVQFALRQDGQIQTEACDLLQRLGFQLYLYLSELGLLAPIRVGDLIDPFVINAVAMRTPISDRLCARGLAAPCVSEKSWSTTGTKVQSVLDQVAASPPFSTWKPNWQPNAIHAGWDLQRRAVALAVEAIRPDLESAQRLAGQMAAYHSVRQALAQVPTGSRLFTFARIAARLGHRVEAVQAVEKIVGAIETAKPHDLALSFTEPMLLPTATAEDVPYTDPLMMIRCSAIESYILLRSHSAWFEASNSSAILARLKDLPVRSQRAERLLEILGGKTGLSIRYNH